MFSENSFADNGYFVFDFKNLKYLQQIKDECERLCKEKFGDKFTSLEQYHQIDVSQEEHDELQYSIYTALNELKLHHKFARHNFEFFKSLLGEDLDIQTNLYLRISRPGLEKDNIGIHRDTDYGNSAYEVSVSLPLVNQKPGSGLNVVPASHLMLEHNTQQVQREDVVKGSDKNVMGFLYAPKVPQSLDSKSLKEVNLNFGQGVGFTLALMHGQQANTGDMTRWSIDFRVKNSFHPTTSNLKQGYYTPFTQSPIAKIAEGYYSINQQEVEQLTTQNHGK